MPFCKVKNATIYYEDVGVGKPIIMLHGFSLDHRLMSGCMEPIFQKREGWRRIYIDLPGMGQSRDYEQIHNSDEMLEAIISFIEALIPNQSYIIVGESYGGYLAQGVIRSQKEKLLGAAFICPMILPNKEDRTVPQQTIVYSGNEFLAQLTKEEVDSFSANQVVLDKYNWERYKNEVLAGAQLADDEFLTKIQNNYGFSFNLKDFQFHSPSLFLLGKQDAVVGYQDAFNTLAQFSRSTFAVLDRAGHNLQIEQPQLFNALIDEWLDRVEESNEKDV
ncbi:alpha/beta fold hydrolase [Lysinibacillus piscis]|uniref:2-hydroxy-6-oxo-6-phenylhexa-2,4-dienoate hydrolase n=1 Tax=Lysinibacillus piscis TaxID=2518931 RepID=A0ABQ5NMV5_9BACI|nr:alpha/beta hydrolase [Lysinibacillus sp. KH24]GLC89624.1 2-hydroxy-6-oxo-6-phenylhexa-2,4-dienoate hydrolase [Lysinibacillus sp. KH24]